jgi:hypothetical protein
MSEPRAAEKPNECAFNIRSAVNLEQAEIGLLSARLISKTSIRIRKTRAILTENEAIKIYQVKLANDVSTSIGSIRTSARSLATDYGVSEKTIRDVWSCRTWYMETLPLDTSRKQMTQPRLPGRPKGAMDTKQRRHYNRQTVRPNLPLAPDPAQGKDRPPALESARSARPALAGHLRIGTTSPVDECDAQSQNRGPNPSGDGRQDHPDDPFHDDWPHWPSDRHQAGAGGRDRI